MNYREAWANGDIEAGTLVDAIEDQAREIERLNSDYNEACEDAMCVARELERQKMNCLNLLQQLEDLKAQPIGVVLPLMAALESVVHDERVPNEVSQEVAAVLIEARRLNSSPVSSAPSHGEQVRHMVPSWMASARTFVDRLHLAGWRDHADAQHAGVAGMYDELLAAAPSAGSQEQGE